MEDDQQFCLRWNNHQSTLISVFDTLLENETLVDCTIAAEGRFLKAHKVVLSACSPYFATLLQEQYDKHPIFILKDVKFQELRAMMDYMYRGEVNISQDQLAALLKAAESLQIKGLSDNRGTAPRPEQPPRANVPIGKGGYTLESKRPRIGPGPLDPQDVSGSREGSSSPSRRRRKVRRRSIENDVHDNSNSSATPQSQQSNANLAGVSAITAAALASQMAAGASVVSPAAIAVVAGQQAGTTALTTNVPKKTETNKGTSDAINAETLQQTTGTLTGTAIAPATTMDEQDTEHIAANSAIKEQKANHKQQKAKDNAASTISPGDMNIEPKSEYDEEANEESVEDLTLDDEMGMEDLDHNAGTSQGGEGSSQDYAWPHDRSQDGLLLTTQDAQQRDPQDDKANLILNLKKEGFKYEEGVLGFNNDGVGGGAGGCRAAGVNKNSNTMVNVDGCEGGGGGGGASGQRFMCSVCGKSYLRKRHLQRHMRDECIGIPPRFSCDLCPSRFRRKYHMVRHLTSKHGIPPLIAQQTTGSTRNANSNNNNNNPNNTHNNNNIINPLNDLNALALNGVLNSLNGAGGVSNGPGSSGGCGEANSSHNDGSTNGSVHGGNDSGCDSPLPENLTVRKENYEHEMLMKPFSPVNLAYAKVPMAANVNGNGNGNGNGGGNALTPTPPPAHHFPCPIPTYGLTGAISAISAAAAVVEEQAAAAAAAAAAAVAANGPSGTEPPPTSSSSSSNTATTNQENTNEMLDHDESPNGGGGYHVHEDGAAGPVKNIITAGIKAEPISPTKDINLMDDEWKMKLSLQLISNSLLKERLMNTMPYAYNNN